MKNILIIGATSAIAIACARRWAQADNHLFLVARNDERLQQIAADLSARSATVTTYVLDVNHHKQHIDMLDHCLSSLKTIDIALIAHGTLPNQSACQEHSEIALQEFHTNGVSVIALLTELAKTMEVQQQGVIAVISSVAGDRGRASNYLYGAAKAAVSTFSSGLRARLSRSGVQLLTIKPGFVDTPMTQHLQLPKMLLASAEKVASDIDSAINNKKNLIYTPWFWRYIMFIIRCIPERLFKRLNL